MSTIVFMDRYRHTSELAIDRLLAGELSTTEAATVQHHAQVCARCGAALSDARAVQDELAAVSCERAANRRRLLARAGAVVSALAAAAALLVTWPRSKPGETRTKGTAIVGFFVAHGDAVRRGGPRETVAPGDRLQLFTTTSEPAWFAAISSDGTVYAESRRVEPGPERVLPGAIELDDALRDERVTGVFCPQTFEARAIDPSAPPTGCTVDAFTLVKVPR